MPELDPRLAEANLEAVETFLGVLDACREGAGISYGRLAYLVGSDADSVKGALHRTIDITLSDLMMIALALDVRLSLGVHFPDETLETSDGNS